jgi:hypothetical protein
MFIGSVKDYVKDFVGTKGIPDQLKNIQKCLCILDEKLSKLIKGEVHMTVEMDNLTASVAAISGVIPSGIAAMQGMAAAILALKDEIANLPPAEQSAALQAFADALNASAADMAGAIAANPV